MSPEDEKFLKSKMCKLVRMAGTHGKPIRHAFFTAQYGRKHGVVLILHQCQTIDGTPLPRCSDHDYVPDRVVRLGGYQLPNRFTSPKEVNAFICTVPMHLLRFVDEE